MINKLENRAAVLIIVALLLAAGIILRFSNLDIKARSPDEVVYTAQAMIVAQDGIYGARRMVDEYNANKQLWIYPPPIRMGYTYLLAAFMKVTSIFDVRAGTYLSTFCSIGALFMLALLGLKFFDWWVTIAALFLMIVSPMDLAIARRSWQDGVLAFAGLLLIYCCSKLTIAPQRKIWYLPFWFIGSWCVMIKESGIIIYGLCFIWLFSVAAFKEKSFIKSALLVLFTILGVSASVFVLGYVVGGIPRLLEVFRHIKDGMPTNAYAIDYQTGPWYRILQGLWIITPGGCILSIIGMAGVFIGDCQLKNNIIAKCFMLIILSFLFITIAVPYMQNLRYLSVTFVPFYLIAGVGLEYLVSLARNFFKDRNFSVVMVVTVLALMIVAYSDYQKFQKIFIKRGIKDISIRLLRESV